MANNAAITTYSGLSIVRKIIHAVNGPEMTIDDELTANQQSQLDVLNKDQMYVTFGRQQSWNYYETDRVTVTVARANVVSGNTIVILSANANSQINVGDTLYFKNSGLPVVYDGGANIISIASGGTILTLNSTPNVTISNATIIRTTTGFTDNNAPPAPAAPYHTYQNIWNNMLGGKIITGNDLCVVTNLHQWTANTVYVKYDPNDYCLFNKPFYVLTSDYAVYKCLDNYNDSPSIEEPSYIPTNDWREPVITSDGYVWKYMFTLSNADIEKFLALDYMPVRFLDSISTQPINQWNVQESAINGAIENIIVLKSGSGYVLPSAGPLTITILGGGGTGATATPNEIETGTGRILTVSVTSSGSGYGTNVSRTFTSTTNTAILTHVGSEISNNYVNSTIIGTNIPANTYVTQIDNLSNPKKIYMSANATANGTVSGGIILGFPRVVFNNGGGVGAEGYISLSGNTIANITMSNTGSGYVPPIVITANGNGKDATFTITSSQIGLNGEILGVNVVNSGNGYSNVAISITGGFGTGAELLALPGPYGGHGSNPQEELGAKALMIALGIEGTESGNLAMTVGNDYRQVALLENPIDNNTGNVLIASTFFQATQIFVTPGITDYQIDEIVYQGTSPANVSFSAIVQAFDSANNVLFVTNTYYKDGVGEPDITQPIIGATSGAYRQFVSRSAPAVERYSGNILFIQNFNPVQRANNQTEYIKIVINQ